MSVGKKNIILAIALCICISVIGVSFAYFVSGVNLTGDGSSVNGTTADLIKVTYDAGTSAIDLKNAVPGESVSKEFSVKVEPVENENTATYHIVLNISANDFEKCTTQNQNEDNNCTVNANELTYTLSDNTGVRASGDLTEANGKVVLLKETKTVSTEETFNYTLELTYVNTGADQNHNENKIFTSNLEVEFAEAN